LAGISPKFTLCKRDSFIFCCKKWQIWHLRRNFLRKAEEKCVLKMDGCFFCSVVAQVEKGDLHQAVRSLVGPPHLLFLRHAMMADNLVHWVYRLSRPMIPVS